MTTTELIRVTAECWKRCHRQWGAGLPSEVIYRDLRPTPLCSARHCLFLTWAGPYGIDESRYLGEYDTREQANRAAGQLRRALYRHYDNA